MFVCKMCKKTFEGEAAFVNGCGSFCSECKGIIHERAREASIARWDGSCSWCGKIVEAKEKVTGERRTICSACDRSRDWLLGCIRHSSKPFEYISITEKREKQAREERREKSPPKASCPPPTLDSKRMDRLERLIGQIADGLGIKG